MLKNCYFLVDNSVPEKERKMIIFCEKCREEKIPGRGWFWEGSKFGYGPFDFVCSSCELVIYSPNSLNKNDNNEEKRSNQANI